MNPDISEVLNNWDYDPDNCIRIIKMNDEREILQVRQPLGIEQYELNGRPDGKKIFGKETILKEYYDKLEEYKQNKHTDSGFKLNKDDFKLLMSEGILFYYRYLLLFQLGEFERTAKDTEHNLKICSFVEKYLDNSQEKNNMLQHRPYVLRLNAISNAMVSLKHSLKSAAQEVLKSAIELLKSMPDIDTPEFRFEKTRSLNYLHSTLTQIGDEEEESPLEEMKRELEQAVQLENYEKAAELRDKIKAMELESRKQNVKKTS